MRGVKFFAWTLVAIPCLVLSLTLLAISIIAFASGFLIVMWAKFIVPVEVEEYVKKQVRKTS
jgi:hypothetical protein